VVVTVPHVKFGQRTVAGGVGKQRRSALLPTAGTEDISPQL
jgi:hypothetical protein